MLFFEKIKQMVFNEKIKSSKHIETELSLKTITEIPLKENKNTVVELINLENEKNKNYKAFKKLITNIQFLCVNKIIDKKVMLVTSPEKEVGKSYVVANMAISFANIGKKVLIIDADLENGRQDKIFNVPNNLGLSNYLSNIDSNGVEINEFLSKYINETAIKNINLITSGIVPPNPAELLSLPKFQELLKDAKVFFDVILIDATEVLGKTEALLLVPNVNSTLIVVSQNKSSIESLNKAKKDIQNVGGNILGVILNEVKIKREKKTKKQRQEEFSRFKLMVKEKINGTIEKIKKKMQDTEQKLLDEAKKENVSEINEKSSNIVKKENNDKNEKIVEVSKKENEEKTKEDAEESAEPKNIKQTFIEMLRNIRKSDEKENKKENVEDNKKEKEMIDIDKNQLSIFQDSSKEQVDNKNQKIEEENVESKVNFDYFKEKAFAFKNNMIEKLNVLKIGFAEKTKIVKEKSIGAYNKAKDLLKNKISELKAKKEELKAKRELKENKEDNDKNIESNEIIEVESESKPEVIEEELPKKDAPRNKEESFENDKMVLVVVDAENGYCRVFSKDYFTEKMVRGFDKKARYIKAHYSSKNLKRRQEYFIDRYQVTQSQSQKIDALIYDTLKDYDEYLWVERKLPSDKAENYALLISKEYEKESNESDKEFFIRSQRQRKLELEDANLEIIYKLDNLWKTRKINIFDKVQMKKFAKQYEIEKAMKNEAEIQKKQKAKDFYEDIISGAERRLEKSENEDKKRAEAEKQVIEEDRKIKQEQLKLEQHELEMEKRAAQERIKLEQENVKAEKRAEAERIKEEKRKEREIEKIGRKEENLRRKREKQKQKEDAKYQKELERLKQREEAKLEEELLVDNLYPKTKHNKNL